jgi:hypothetical protein
MAIESHKIETHWNYLYSIERDLENLARYIEFNNDNFKCYSIEISKILMLAAAEVDVVCKQLCKKINPASRADSIGVYRSEILLKYRDIPKFKVVMPRYGLKLTPWSNWKNRIHTVPFWWTAYNKIKHHRHTHYERGNLKNALNAIAGLFIMNLYLYQEKANLGELIPPLKLLHVSEEYFVGRNIGGYESGFTYNIIR